MNIWHINEIISQIMYDYKRMQRSFLYKIKHISEQAGKLDSITETDVSPKNLYIFIWPDFFINQALFIVNKSIMQYTIYKIIGTSINNIWQKLPYVLVLQLWFHKENKLKRRLFWYITISSSFKIIINLRFDK